jgi:hypothetical protein
VIDVLTPYERLAHDVVHHTGTNRALAALARDVIPTESAV